MKLNASYVYNKFPGSKIILCHLHLVIDHYFWLILIFNNLNTKLLFKVLSYVNIKITYETLISKNKIVSLFRENHKQF